MLQPCQRWGSPSGPAHCLFCCLRCRGARATQEPYAVRDTAAEQAHAECPTSPAGHWQCQVWHRFTPSQRDTTICHTPSQVSPLLQLDFALGDFITGPAHVGKYCAACAESRRARTSTAMDLPWSWRRRFRQAMDRLRPSHGSALLWRHRPLTAPTPLWLAGATSNARRWGAASSQPWRRTLTTCVCFCTLFCCLM